MVSKVYVDESVATQQLQPRKAKAQSQLAACATWWKRKGGVRLLRQLPDHHCHGDDQDAGQEVLE